MKDIGFKIVVDDSGAKSALRDLQKELGRISGLGAEIKVRYRDSEIKKIEERLRRMEGTVRLSVSDDDIRRISRRVSKLSGGVSLGYRDADIKKIEARLGRLKANIKLGVSDADIKRLQVGLSGLSMDRLNSSILVVNRNLVQMNYLLSQAAGLSSGVSVSGGGGGVSGGGGQRVNNGSRSGILPADSTRALLGTFSGFIRGGQNLPSQIGAFASGIGRIGFGAGAVLGTLAISVRGLIGAIADIKEFGKVNAELAAILGKTREGTAQLTEQQIKLGAAMAFTSSQIGGAQISLAKLGFTQEEIMDSTEGVARFALVVGANIPDAAEAAGAALRSFDLDAAEMDRVVSVLGVSTAKSALSFEKLKVGIGTTFATAKTFGLEIEDVTALLGELSNKGLSASVAATATRNILLNLADDSGKLRKTLAGLGVNEVKGLEGIVNALRALRASGIDLAQTFELTDKRSVNAFNTFLRGSDDLIKLRDSLVDVNEQFRIMEKERLNSLDGSLTLLMSALERLNLTFGQLFGAESFLQIPIDAVTGFLNTVSDFLERPAGDAVKKEMDAILGMLDVIRDGNLAYGTRSAIIERLKINYADLVKGIDLERASNAELLKLIEKVRVEYDLKYARAKGQTEFEKGLERERKLLEEQIKLIQKRQNLKFGSFDYKNNYINQQVIDNKILEEQEKQVDRIRNQYSITGDVDAEQLYYLERIFPKDYKERGIVLNEVQKRAEFLISNIYDVIDGVRKKYDRKFSKQEFYGSVKDGKVELSVVDQYLAFLEEEKQKLGNGVLGREVGKIISEIQKLQGDMESKIDIIGDRDGKGDRGSKDKYTPLEGSLDYLELMVKQAEEAIKRTNIVTTDNYKKLVDAAKKAKDELDKRKAEIEGLRALTPKQRLDDAIGDLEFLKNNRDIIARDSIKDEKQLQLQLQKNEREFRIASIKERIKSLAEENKVLLEATDERYKEQRDVIIKAINRMEQDIIQEEVELMKITGDIKLETARVIGEKYLMAANEIARKEISNLEDRNNEILLNEARFQKALLELRIKNNIVEGKSNLKEVKELQELNLKISGLEAKRGFGGFNDALAEGYNKKVVLSDLGQRLVSGLGSKKDWQEYYKLAREAEYEQALAAAEKKLEILNNDENASIKDKRDAEREIFELKLGYQEELYKDELDKRKDILNKLKKGAEIFGDVYRQIIEYQRVEVQNNLDAELRGLEALYNAKISNAQGNQAEIERLESEYRQKREAAEKRAAQKRKEIALKEATIQLALGIIKAIPDYVLIGLAAVTGAIQIATIQKQRFAKGGFTGKGLLPPDETGQRPVGIVHENEYVAPTKQIRKYPALFKFLDDDRKKFASGGFTTAAPTVLGTSYLEMYKFAEIIAVETASRVYDAAYAGTMAGSEGGTRTAIRSASRESLSRQNSLSLNTF